jgi:tetratricopeptide (TPR) repeat protein
MLAIASACLWVYSFWVDPMLGAFRDWDLICGYGVVLSLMSGGVLIEKVRPTRSHWWVAMLVLAIVHVGSWVAANLSPDQSARRVDRLVREDMHYSNLYDLGGRRAAWAFILTSGLQWLEPATDHYLYRLTYNPADAVSWANLGIIYQHRNIPDSAIICYERAMKAVPNNAYYVMLYGLGQHAAGHLRLARVALERAVRLMPGYYDAEVALGRLYLDLGMLDEAEQQARLALTIDSTQTDARQLLEDITKRRRESAEP